MRRGGPLRKLNGEAAGPIAAVSAPDEPKSAVAIPDIELRLTPRDLWFVAQALRFTAWGGGEQRVTALHNIHKALRLDKIQLNVLPTAQPLKPVECVKLPHPHVELMIRVLCGEGDRSFNGEAGPMMSALVIRLRETVVAAVKEAVQAAQVQATKAAQA